MLLPPLLPFRSKTGETYICFGATAKEMEEEWVSDSLISRYGDSPARTLRFVYLSIGGEIAELMRFLQLNGKTSRTIPLRTENMALSGERFGPIFYNAFASFASFP